MKKNVTLSVFSVLWSVLCFGQTQFSKDYESVRTELVNWDAVRGEWLANSFEAMVSKQAIPERTFPEDLTPDELFRLVPKQNKQNIQRIVTERENSAPAGVERDAWRRIAVLTRSNGCQAITARSYGDPHLVSFDGARFSFQTVGEFVLAKSASGHMEVQARQRAESSDFSLNTAIAMNVAGDRLCFYGNEKPDSDRTSLFRLNGNPIQVDNRTYHLPHGGTVVKSGKKEYVVSWPSGERVIMDLNTFGSMDFVNLTIEIIPCLDEEFAGVFGNANRNVNDDFRTANGRSPKENFVTFVSSDPQVNRVAREIEQEHLAYIARDFANDWRVTNETTLFDYAFGENTMTYTDYSFPRVHRTLHDLTPDQQATARRSCEEEGIRGSDLDGCIYDRGFLNIPANPAPVVRDRTEGVVLAKIEQPVRTPSDDKNPSGSGGVIREKPQDKINTGKTDAGTAKPVTKQDETPEKKPSEDVKFEDVFKPGVKKPSTSSGTTTTPTKSSGGTTPAKTSTPATTTTPKTPTVTTPVKTGKGK